MAGSVGLNFGSSLLNDVMIWPIDKPIPEAMWTTAVSIYAFDALIQNPDRKFSPNPNLFTRADQIFVFDHELAFSFLESIFTSKTPWKLDQSRYLSDHVFFRRLKGLEIDLVTFHRAIDRPANLSASLPSWRTSRQSGKIVAYRRSAVTFARWPNRRRSSPNSTKEPCMRTPYTFSVLRYIHDPVTQEFVNIGVALYSQKAGFFRATCTTHYGRITNLFNKIDGNRFRQLTRYIQEQVNAIGAGLTSELPFEANRTIENLLGRVLPPDDSSIQFSRPVGVGLSVDLEKALAELFDRYVERYATRSDVPRRDDDDIWRVFREPLDNLAVTPHLTPKRIVAPSYEYEFERAWKNKIWHVYQPVSFDLMDAGSILEKANKWVGRATSLNESNESFKIHVLLGEPQDERLQNALVKAQNILNKMPGQKEFVRESEAESFAEELAHEVEAHEKHRVPISRS